MTMIHRIEIDGTRMVILPERQYDELVNAAGNPKLPEFPPTDENGNYPASETMRVSIARKLIMSRTAAGLSQAELAKRAGVRQETISRIETGKVRAEENTMKKIVNALKKCKTIQQ